MKLNIVPASTGLQWVKLGFRTFLKQPLALAALIFMYATLEISVIVLPIVAALLPIARLGLMAATRVAEADDAAVPTIVFTALRAGRERLRSMVVLGFLYAATLFALALVVALFVPIATEGKGALEIYQSDEFALRVLLTSVLYLPVAFAFWHAPALVHWHGVPVGKSLFFSFVACLRNFRAFLVYGLAWFAIMIAIVAASELAGIVSPWLSGVVFGAAGTIATIAFYTSLYFTFRDSFLDA